MRTLRKEHIVDLFVWVDDSLPKQIQTGRPSALQDSELLTILIWDGLCEPHKNLSSIYAWIEREYCDYFPYLPKYQNFVAHVHRLLPQMVWFLQTLLAKRSTAPLCRQHHAARLQANPCRQTQSSQGCSPVRQELAGLALRFQAPCRH